MLNLILFGPPGSGKGTQSEKIIGIHNLKHLSTGDLLRKEIAIQSNLGIEAKKIMDKGILVPDEIVINMISQAIDSSTNIHGFLFDGFPRTVAQCKALDTLLAQKKMAIDILISLVVPETELVKRLLTRGLSSGRPDDHDEAVIKQRIEEYNNKTTVVKNYYAQSNKVVEVTGSGSIESIFSTIDTELRRVKSI